MRRPPEESGEASALDQSEVYNWLQALSPGLKLEHLSVQFESRGFRSRRSLSYEKRFTGKYLNLFFFFILPLLGTETKCQTTSENKKSNKCFKKVKKATTAHGSSVQSNNLQKMSEMCDTICRLILLFLSFMHTNLAFPSTKANAGIGYTNIYKALLEKTGELNIDDIF